MLILLLSQAFTLLQKYCHMSMHSVTESSVKVCKKKKKKKEKERTISTEMQIVSRSCPGGHAYHPGRRSSKDSGLIGRENRPGVHLSRHEHRDTPAVKSGSDV